MNDLSDNGEISRTVSTSHKQSTDDVSSITEDELYKRYYKLRYLCSSEEALNNFVGVADLNTNNLDTEMVPDSNPLNFAPDHTLNFNPVY